MIANRASFFARKHFGPGPHPSGSDQDVHGKHNDKITSLLKESALNIRNPDLVAKDITEESKKFAYENGFGLEYSAITGNMTYEEMKELNIHIGYDIKNPATLANLQRYLGSDNSKAPLSFFESSLDGKYGEKYKQAAQLIQSQSQEIFKQQFGEGAYFFRVGERVSGIIGVSESSTLAARAASVTSPESFDVMKIYVKYSDVLFSYRVVFTPFPEREWVVKMNNLKHLGLEEKDETQKHLEPSDHSSESSQDVHGGRGRDNYEHAMKSTWRPWSIFENTFVEKVLEALFAQLLLFTDFAQRDQENTESNSALWEQLIDVWQKTLQPVIVDVAQKAVKDTVKQIYLTTSYEMTNFAASEWANLYAAEQVKNINKTTREALRREIADWIASNKDGGIDNLIKRIENMKGEGGIPLFGRQRAERIAQSELTTIYAQAKSIALEKNGYRHPVFLPRAHVNCRCYIQPATTDDGTKVVVWYTARDEMVCTKPIETPFGTVNGCKELHRTIVSEGYAGTKLERRMEK